MHCGKFENILFGDTQGTTHKKGSRYVDGVMKSYEQQKKGLGCVYCKHVDLPNGIKDPLNI